MLNLLTYCQRTTTTTLTFGLALFLVADALQAKGTHHSANKAQENVERMLLDFAADYQNDPSARVIVFGIEVRDVEPSKWHVVVETPAQEKKGLSVKLLPDFPDKPVAYFSTDAETLRRIYEGKLSSLTAMGKETATDIRLLEVKTMPNFQPAEDTAEIIKKAAFHFWTRGLPEKVAFGDLAQTRVLHGGNGTLFYYDQGLRTGFFKIQPGEHVNKERAEQTNPFQTFFILTKGRVSARIGGTECEIKTGEAVYIGPEITHEFWIDKHQPESAEGILVMFGEGA